MSEEPEVIALTTLFQDGPSVRGKIPVALVKALKAKGGDILAFERQPDGAIVVRKSTAAERKAGGR
jgi:antitoxin component of MazEF toxin-antitoxin module